MAMSDPSGPDVQATAQAMLLAGVAEQLGVALEPRRLALPGGAAVDVDGVDVAQSVFVEILMRQGRLKGPQLDKVARDALKLVTLARAFTATSLVIAFADATAAASVTGQSWLSESLRIWGVQVLVVELPDDVREALRGVQGGGGPAPAA
jgi:hypothetical protein